jgi:hypothetical protein
MIFIGDHGARSLESIVQLYLGIIKVLTNSSTLFIRGLAIVEGSEKDQVAGLELTERSRGPTSRTSCMVFFHPMAGMQGASCRQVQHGHRRGRNNEVGIRDELLQIKESK